jgi:probable rRNA maturation factor
MVSLHNRQRAVRVDLDWLRTFAARAHEKCRVHHPRRRGMLEELREIEISIVSDRVMSELHRKFLGCRGPTDVITFQHGEIVISAGTARQNAARFGQRVDAEIALYIIHGLLHLNGFEDATRHGAAQMHELQIRVMNSCLDELTSRPIP